MKTVVVGLSTPAGAGAPAAPIEKANARTEAAVRETTFAVCLIEPLQQV